MPSTSRILATILTAFLACGTSRAVELPGWAQVRSTAPRHALVIGIADYDGIEDLKTPTADAAKMESKLRGLGFDVVRPTVKLDRKALIAAVNDFIATLRRGDLAVVYYSGHGAERGGVNYLIPADLTHFDAGREGYQAVSLDWIMHQLDDSGVSLSVIVLDACRNDPFPQAGAPALVGPKGLAPPTAEASGVFLGYAAAPGATSWSGTAADTPGQPSIFTRRLADEIGQTGRSLYWIWNSIGHSVFEDTQHNQRPWHGGALFPELKLQASPADQAEEDSAWSDAVVQSTPATLRANLEAFLVNYPVSDHAKAARERIAQLDAQTRIAGAPSSRAESLAAQISRLQATLATAQVRGSLTDAVTVAGRDGRLLSATYATSVRSAPRGGAASVAEIGIGSTVKLLGTPDRNGWAPVQLKGGRFGYLAGVDLQTPVVLTPPVNVLFANAATSVGTTTAIDDAVRAAGTDSTVSIAVGPATAELEDRARSLAYLRALGLRRALVNAGMAADRIEVSFGADPAVAADQATLTVKSTMFGRAR